MAETKTESVELGKTDGDITTDTNPAASVSLLVAGSAETIDLKAETVGTNPNEQTSNPETGASNTEDVVSITCVSDNTDTVPNPGTVDVVSGSDIIDITNITTSTDQTVVEYYIISEASQETSTSVPEVHESEPNVLQELGGDDEGAEKQADDSSQNTVEIVTSDNNQAIQHNVPTSSANNTVDVNQATETPAVRSFPALTVKGELAPVYTLPGRILRRVANPKTSSGIIGDGQTVEGIPQKTELGSEESSLGTSMEATQCSNHSQPESQNACSPTPPISPGVSSKMMPASDDEFIVELTSMSVTGGVKKPMTITVLNVTGLTFKCSKCKKPFDKQLYARSFTCFREHDCETSNSGPASSVSQDELQLLSPKKSPSARSGARTISSSTPKLRNPVGRPRKHALPVTPKSEANAKLTPPAQKKSKVMTTPKPSPTKQNSSKDEPSESQEKQSHTTEESEEKPLSKAEQLEFIKEEFNKANRWNLRSRGKNRKVKTKRNAVEDSDEETPDAGEVEDPEDPDFKGDVEATIAGEFNSMKEASDMDTTYVDPKMAKSKDFCINCYLNIEHTCKVKKKAANKSKSKTCQICHKTYKTMNSLNQHMRAHTGERPFQCKDCGKAFRRSSTMFEHMQIHNGEKKFLCSICGRKFLRKSDHTAHIRLHNNDFTHKCEKCGKGFKGNSQLEIHMRKHTGEMPFLCTICGRKFKHPFGLRVHMKYHEMAENPLRCTECDTVHSDPDELRMHDCPKGKQHMCTVCGKTFANPFAVKGHMKIHIRPNPSVCKSCQVTFPNEQELQIHQDSNIVKCSDCQKTIKEARSCMLNKLPGSGLKGKKFKCWKCHSAQVGVKSTLPAPAAAEPEPRKLPPPPPLQRQPSIPTETSSESMQTDSQPEEMNVVILRTPVPTDSQLHSQDVVHQTYAHHQTTDQTIIHTVIPDITQIHSYHSNPAVSVHMDTPYQLAQDGQQTVAEVQQPVPIAIYPSSPGEVAISQTVVHGQLNQAIQSIQSASADHSFYTAPQTVYTDLGHEIHSSQTVHFVDQEIAAHQIQYPTNSQQQQVHTVYQIQQVQEDSTIVQTQDQQQINQL